jgi:leader peptidase (prepilin peptidase)/N-methyltransferase
MIALALLACVVSCVNCCYAAAGLAAARRFGIELSLARGFGLGILAAGTAFEVAAIALHVRAAAVPVAILSFGAVLAAAACDAQCGYVFDTITGPCLAALIALAALQQELPALALGVGACGGSLALLYALTLGRGLGFGDVKLACCIGAGAGAANGIRAIGIAFVLGAAYAVYLLAAKRAQRGHELRFAPYLAAGMGAVLLGGALA